MSWSGMESGNSKQYALSMRIERRLTRLLQTLSRDWPEFDLTHHKSAEYDEHYDQVVVSLEGEQSSTEVITGYVWFDRDDDDEETYLLTSWEAKPKRLARQLARDATRPPELRLSGSTAPEINEREWYARRLPLSDVEKLPSDEQLGRIKQFVQETFRAVENSGILSIQREQSD